MDKKDKKEKERMLWANVIYYLAPCFILLASIFSQDYIYSFMLKLLTQRSTDYDAVLGQGPETLRFILKPVATVISVTLLLTISIIVIYLISKPFRKAKALPLGLIRVKKFLAFSIAFTVVLVWIYDKMVPFNPGRYGISAQRIYEIAHETVPSSENVPLIEITSLSSKKRLITQNTFENIFNSIK